MIFKYRDIEKWQFIEDIIKNNRLYASPFNKLNDAREGHYIYTKNKINEKIIKEIYYEKISLGIVSLSKSWDINLLWTYYASGHKGLVFGIEVDTNKYEVRDVEYVENIYDLDDNYSNITKNRINIDSKDKRKIAMNILTHKTNDFSHEQEKRIFTKNNERFVNVKIKEIIFGYRMDEKTKSEILKLVNLYNQEISITEMKQDLGVFYKKEYKINNDKTICLA